MWEPIVILTPRCCRVVLILVCVEDSVGEQYVVSKAAQNLVLILVCVEDSVGVFNFKIFYYGEGKS